MTEEEIKERIIKCEIIAQEYREVNNTRRAKLYEEIYKWEKLLDRIKPIDQDYKRGYYHLQQRIDKAIEKIYKIIESNNSALSNPEYTIVNKHKLIELNNNECKKLLEILGSNDE